MVKLYPPVALFYILGLAEVPFMASEVSGPSGEWF